MTISDTNLSLAQRVADRFSQLPEVEAIAIAGSQATGVAGHASDIDLYIYSRVDIPADARYAIGKEFADKVEIVDFWGPGTEWDDPQTGIHMDVIFFNAPWIQDQIDRILKRHEAWLGYTTCFWHTVRVSQALFDRNGWFAALQKEAAVDYPEPLRKNIVKQNYPVLRQLVMSSYSRQLEKAAARSDIVSLNHRAAGLLASYFDILFAVNRLPHPGEKRLLDFAEKNCAKLPANMRQDVTRLIQTTADPAIPVKQAVNSLLDALDVLLREEGLLG
jgi:predicted nucleotidyltransferase